MNVGRYLRGEDRHVGTARTTQFQQPQRTWVGLTDGDKSEIRDMTERDDRDSVMQLVEDKLKEKNK